ncbi:hypothetical protein IQ265_12760 [Nodosilinea sp. LEGE 06152]|uniref:hypothetical protein n=1 Tax=Nodosilinea sp. LEGE 06152 TaxID=2777966 RepID=UPI00188257EC|nr:hypothetical protein [Nodosilinea sp. LEGE 06152]MBE9157690.1 hypothetical protein [Nodosilinea sp. LEGE 06152]
MADFRLRARRTIASGPPPNLLFGEMAYSDADQKFYIGRADTEQPPATFDGTPTDYSGAIAGLEQGLIETGESLSVVQLNQLSQAGAIAALSTDLATLVTSNATQDTAIAALGTATGNQAAAIATLATSDAAQAQAIAVLNAAIDRPWHYVGSTEPLTPHAGFKWWEVTSSGASVEQWEWDADVLRWVGIKTNSRPFSVSGTGNLFTAVSVAADLPDPTGPILMMGFQGVAWINTTANASNYYILRNQLNIRDPASDSTTNGAAFITLSGQSQNLDQAGTNLTVASSAKSLHNVPSGIIGFRLWVAATGSPGAVRITVSVLYKRVRKV